MVCLIMSARTCEDLQRIYSKGLVINSINLDDGQRVAVDGECEVRVAGYGDQAKSVAKEVIRSRIV
jgi:hypothetical protein